MHVATGFGGKNCGARLARPLLAGKSFSAKKTFNSTDIQSVLICGPSGVGKGSLIAKLLNEFPNDVALSVSRTSRSPRVGEIHGVHYYFVDRDGIKKDIAEGDIPYLEYAEVHGNLYGTRVDAVYDIHKQNKICILDLDTKGAQSLQEKKFPVYSVFVVPPSIEALESRLMNRGSETAEQRQLRLDNAKAQIEFGTQNRNFNCILVNDNLDECYSRLMEQLRSWFPKHFSVNL